MVVNNGDESHARIPKKKSPTKQIQAKHHLLLVVSTLLKNTSQNGNLPQIGVKIKNTWNHHLDKGYNSIYN